MDYDYFDNVIDYDYIDFLSNVIDYDYDYVIVIVIMSTITITDYNYPMSGLYILEAIHLIRVHISTEHRQYFVAGGNLTRSFRLRGERVTTAPRPTTYPSPAKQYKELDSTGSSSSICLSNMYESITNCINSVCMIEESTHICGKFNDHF